MVVAAADGPTLVASHRAGILPCESKPAAVCRLAADQIELQVQMDDGNQARLQKEPEGDMYFLVVDLAAIDKNRTRVEVYGGGDYLQSARARARGHGKLPVCPSGAKRTACFDPGITRAPAVSRLRKTVLLAHPQRETGTPIEKSSSATELAWSRHVLVSARA